MVKAPLLVVAGVVTGLLVGGTTVAVASTAGSGSVTVCTTKSGVVRSAKASGACPRHTTRRTVADAGQRGPAGAKGAAGATGSRGPAGTAGTNGVNGVDGSDGTDGTDGDRGPIGLTGLPGQNGQDGTAGDPGIQGPRGEQGVQGNDGRDGTAFSAGRVSEKGELRTVGSKQAAELTSVERLDTGTYCLVVAKHGPEVAALVATLDAAGDSRLWSISSTPSTEKCPEGWQVRTTALDLANEKERAAVTAADTPFSFVVS